MANTLIVPGVLVSVVKDVLPQQLSPSGVLGLIGYVANTDVKRGTEIRRAGSWNRFLGECGADSAYSLPEARQALDNGVAELVISPLDPTQGTRAAVTLSIARGTELLLKLRAEAALPGTWAHQIDVEITLGGYDSNTKAQVFDLTVSRGDEVIGQRRNLNTLTALEVLKDRPIGPLRFMKAEVADAAATPEDGQRGQRYRIRGGADAPVSAYRDAIDRLRNEADVDLVLAAVQDFSNVDNLRQVYLAVIAHCERMADECKGRIGLGQIAPGTPPASATQLASALKSDRFVLLAPHGVAGATAGMIGNLTYFHSPTFKRTQGLPELRMDIEDQRQLLSGAVVPVVSERGKGTILLRGLTTDGDQISVRRTADRAVRGVKMISELFIGRLNNADGRSTLKQKLTEFLLQMERDGALVPSTDGADPAFKVNVYSSQADFALGIVRVDLAVRPVRAIDYIYATLQVQV